MRQLTRTFPFLLLLAVFILPSPLQAKGPTAKITLSAPDLPELIEIDDPAVLDRFDPWAGQFIGTGGPLESPPHIGRRIPLLVFFYHQNELGDLNVNYVFYYYPDPAGDRGLIYMPGADEPYYSLNASTIMRGSVDGAWYHAMPAWDAAVQPYLPDQTAITLTNNASPMPTNWFIVPGAAILLIALLYWVRRSIQTTASFRPSA